MAVNHGKHFMKSIIKTGLVVFSLFVIQTTVAYATGYNYLPNDVFLVQQAEKSALEYRLSALENQYQSNPQISILSIDQRISELQRQRDSEKEYLKGTLAHSGAYSPETWASYSAKIDAKYDPQINSLNQQKQTYQSQVSGQQQKDQEVAELKRLILEMQNSIDKQADLERQKVLDNLALEQQKLTEEYTPSAMEIFTYLDSSNINWITAANQFETLKTTNFSLYYDVLMIAESRYFKGYTPETLFVYLESLSQKEVSAYITKLRIFNPNLLELANRIARVKYPNGKFNDDGTLNTTTPKPSVTPTVASSLKPSPKVEKKVVAVPTSNTTATSVQATSEIKQDALTDSTAQQAREVKPEKKSFVQKSFDFFKKIIFWR